MSWIQSFFKTILPASWAQSMEQESREWHIQCHDCGYSASVWDLGGIRWKAKSYKKITLVRCPCCQGFRRGDIVRKETTLPVLTKP